MSIILATIRSPAGKKTSHSLDPNRSHGPGIRLLVIALGFLIISLNLQREHSESSGA